MGKGKTVRQIHHFTDGLWSPDMDARADLASSVNSCRKLENFQVDQYGEAIRRPGLQYVGGALGECLAIDPLFSYPDWESLDNFEEITPVDVYGSHGPEEVRFGSNASDWWLVCDWLVHCFGPTAEGATMVDNTDRYLTRWHAKLEDGKIYYGIVGQPWQQVSNNLVSQPIADATGIGFSFDANARPVFSTQIGSNTHIYRYVAGTPATYNFSGIGSKLFFNGTIQQDNALWDVVCYYCRLGRLCARFQRDNFGTEYILYDNEDNYFTKVKHTDYGIGGELVYHFIAASGSLGLRGLFRSWEYPLWPSYAADSFGASLSILTDGSYDLVVPFAPTQLDSVSSTLSLDLDGDYFDTIIESGPYQDAVGTNTLSILGDGDYALVVIDGGTYGPDAITGTLALATDGDYALVIVAGGTYTDTATSTFSLNTDGDYTT